MFVSEIDPHPNRAADAIFAEVLGTFLREQGLRDVGRHDSAGSAEAKSAGAAAAAENLPAIEPR